MKIAIIRTIVVFFSGVTASINLTHLIGHNEEYEAAWWKVVFAVLIALTFGLWRGER